MEFMLEADLRNRVTNDSLAVFFEHLHPPADKPTGEAHTHKMSHGGRGI